LSDNRVEYIAVEGIEQVNNGDVVWQWPPRRIGGDELHLTAPKAMFIPGNRVAGDGRKFRHDVNPDDALERISRRCDSDSAHTATDVNEHIVGPNVSIAEDPSEDVGGRTAVVPPAGCVVTEVGQSDATRGGGIW
jgi:hypothetical protein